MKLDSAKLKTARLAKGLTLQQVSRKCRLSIVTVSNAENGRDVYPGTAKTLCDFLGLNLGDAMVPLTRDEDDGSAA